MVSQVVNDYLFVEKVNKIKIFKIVFDITTINNN